MFSILAPDPECLGWGRQAPFESRHLAAITVRAAEQHPSNPSFHTLGASQTLTFGLKFSMLGLSPDVMSELWFGFMFFMFAGFVLWENERNTFPIYKKKKKNYSLHLFGFFFSFEDSPKMVEV